MAWRLNPALTRWRAAVNERYPKRDQASDGTIGDEAHQAGSSDHNQDSDGTVDAWDMDVEVHGPGKPYSADVEALKRVFEAHEAARYWIHNDQIAHRDRGWRREPYQPNNPDRNRHVKHVHWNSNQATENSTKPWIIEGDDVGKITDPAQAQQLRDSHWTLTHVTMAGKSVPMHVALTTLLDQNKAIADTLARVASGQIGMDLREQLEIIDERAEQRAQSELERDQRAAVERAELRQLLVELDAGALTQDELVSRIRVSVEATEPGDNAQ